MKQLVFFLFFVAFSGAWAASFLSGRTTVQGTLPWQVQTLDMWGNVGEYSALALDADGRPHLVYYDRAIDTRLTYGYWDGLIWRFETLPVLLPDNYIFQPGLSLAVDAQGQAHIAYYEGQAQDVYYARRSADGWQISLVDAAGDVGSDLSLKLANDLQPHISYYDATNQDLKYAWWNGLNWQSEVIDSAGDVGQYNTLAIDSAGNPHISYYDTTNANLKYAYKSGNSWQFEVVHAEGDAGRGASLALDEYDDPHIAYVYAGASSFELYYARKIGTLWSFETFSTPNVGTLTLALAPNGVAHIAYDALGSYLYHAHNAMGTWVVTSVDTGSENGINPALAVDPSGLPHISYYLKEYHDLRYATQSETWQIVTADTPINSNSFISMAYDSEGSPHLAYNELGYLQLAGWDGNSWVSETPLATAVDPRHIDLAYDTQGNPHLALYNQTSGDLIYGSWNGAGWVFNTIDSAGDVGQYATLMFNRQGMPVIAYWDNSNYQVKVAALENAAWVIGAHTAAPPLNADSGHLSAGFALTGDVFISYYDAANTDLRVAVARLNGDTWAWQDELLGISEGHTGPAHDLAMIAAGHSPAIAYVYSDTAGNKALRYATRVVGPVPAWRSTQFRPLGVDGVVSLGLALRADNGNLPRVAYILDEPAQKSLWLASTNGNNWRFETFGAIGVSAAYRWPKPVVLANGVDRIAYVDGSQLRLASRATTEELPFFTADHLGYNPSREGGWAGCLCLLKGCDNESAQAVEVSMAPGGEMTQVAIYEEMATLFSATPGGQHYVDLYREHGLEMYTLMTASPVLFWDSYRTLSEFLPGLQALVTGRGDEVVITGDMIAHAYDIWLWLSLLGSPEIRQTINTELARSNNLQDFAGMTFNEWARAIGVEPPERQKVFLPLVVK